MMSRVSGRRENFRVADHPWLSFSQVTCCSTPGTSHSHHDPARFDGSVRSWTAWAADSSSLLSSPGIMSFRLTLPASVREVAVVGVCSRMRVLLRQVRSRLTARMRLSAFSGSAACSLPGRRLTFRWTWVPHPARRRGERFARGALALRCTPAGLGRRASVFMICRLIARQECLTPAPPSRPVQGLQAVVRQGQQRRREEGLPRRRARRRRCPVVLPLAPP